MDSSMAEQGWASDGEPIALTTSELPREIWIGGMSELPSLRAVGPRVGRSGGMFSAVSEAL